MTSLLEPARMEKALQLITKPESCSSHVDLKVRCTEDSRRLPNSTRSNIKSTFISYPLCHTIPLFIFQTCSDILDSMTSGEFGPAGRSATDGFRSRCAKLFPHSVKFRPPHQQQQQQTTVCLNSS